MTEYMRDGFVRQRRNLMMVSAALLLVESADVKFSELNLLGNKFLIENPGVINIGLWIAFLYWLYRYYVYFHDIGEKGFVSKYRSRMMDLVCAIAFKQLNTTRTEWLPSATQGKTRLQLGPDRSFYQRLLWRYEIKLSVLITTTSGVDGQSPELRYFDHHVVSDRVPLAVAHLRAWLHVLTKTHLFSEYLLPFAVALLPVANHVCVVVGRM